MHFAFKYIVFIFYISFLFYVFYFYAFVFGRFVLVSIFLLWEMVVGILFLSIYRQSVLGIFFLTYCMFCVSHFDFGILILEI